MDSFYRIIKDYKLKSKSLEMFNILTKFTKNCNGKIGKGKITRLNRTFWSFLRPCNFKNSLQSLQQIGVYIKRPFSCVFTTLFDGTA